MKIETRFFPRYRSDLPPVMGRVLAKLGRGRSGDVRFERRHREFERVRRPRVNWTAMGDCTPAQARRYAKLILAAADRAEGKE